MEGMIGEIRMFGGNFAPRAWALCDGQLLPINQNQALFSIIGTIYGGDGRTTFALPDCRGRCTIGPGNGPGLSSRREGQKGGTETGTMNITQMPSHNHTITTRGSNVATGLNPSSEVFAPLNVRVTAGPEAPYTTVSGAYAATHNGTMNSDAVMVQDTAGGGQSFNLMQPFTTVNFVICLQGVFPSRS